MATQVTPVAAARAGRQGEIVVDPRSRGLPRVGERLGDVALIALFLAIDGLRMANWSSDLRNFGDDGSIYRTAAAAWLAGGNPWTALSDTGAYFAGPPPTLLLALPFVPLGDLATRVIWIAVALGSAIWAVRALKLPAWWLAFPPLWISVMAGNPNALVLAALVARAGPLAVVAKIYAGIPLVLLRRWRELAATAIVLAVTFPLLPWWQFVESWPEISRTFAAQSASLSAWGTLLIVPAAIGILLLGRQGAWLAVPALWPATQIHYAALALPGVSRLTAALLAIQVPLAPVLAVGVALLERWLRRQKAHEAEVVVGRADVGPVVPDEREARRGVVLDRDRVDILGA